MTTNAEPVAPLPTDPWTVIRVVWEHGDEHHCYVLGPDRWWQSTAHNRPPIRSTDLAGRITGFEVLAEPVDARFSERAIRKATAKAVLARVASEPWAREVDLTKWRGEFGVES